MAGVGRRSPWVAVVGGDRLAGGRRLAGAARGVTIRCWSAARDGATPRWPKTEALASWAEMLRDTIAAHAGLHEAIAVDRPGRAGPDPRRGAGARGPGRARLADGSVAARSPSRSPTRSPT